MAKKSEKKNGTLLLRYSVSLLPSAQHKMGLAGLVLLLDTMRERKITPLPQYEEISPGTWEFVFDQESLQTVFDELYDAESITMESGSKWTGAEPKEIKEREVEKGGAVQKEKVYLYDITVPKEAFLKGIFPQGTVGEKRIRLWRDMLWNTYKGKPTTRNAYKERLERKPCSMVPELWRSLTREKQKSEEVAGSLFLGAESVNAEKTPFMGTPRDKLLLHCTHVACPVFVARGYTIKRGKKENTTSYAIETKEDGFVLVMLEIHALRPFLGALREWLGSSSKEEEDSEKGYRPWDSLIDLPEESGLRFLSSIASYRMESQGVLDDVQAAEYYHMAKHGNSIKVLSSSRIPVTRAKLNEYTGLTQRKGKNVPLNFLYKTAQIRNILNDDPWYSGLEELLYLYPAEFFIWTGNATPTTIPFFGRNINDKLRQIQERLSLYEKEAIAVDKEGKDTRDERLALKIRDIVRQYVITEVQEKAKNDLPAGKKTHLEWTKGDGDEDGTVAYSQRYREIVSKVCSSAFLALRARSDSDIAEFFTGTLCAIPQYMRRSSKAPEADEYLLIAKSLIDPEERKKAKLFAMLALSACSFVPFSKEIRNDSGNGTQSQGGE